MLVHVFSFKWRLDATAEDAHRAVAEIRGFARVIPGLLELWIGTNVSTKSPGFSTTGVMVFKDREAYAAYQTNEVHQRLLRWLVPKIDPLELDFEARNLIAAS